jgi:diaminohydroxyphosphoribosylaminopyrimidine deaminase/5-amino-6-(5-phosphoribosylamino)uracil reductase
MVRRRPFVIVKIALSVDGCIAKTDGVPVRLTGAEADRVIQRQRAEIDAIAVGSSTVLADDPRLTARGAWRERPLARVVFDRRQRTPIGARLLSTQTDGPIIVMTRRAAMDAQPDVAAGLERAGARVVAMDDGGIAASFAWLFREMGITSILVEGGAALHRALFDEELVDAVHAYIAPARLGDAGMKWMDPRRLTLSELSDRRAEWFGADVRVEGHVHRHH